jgi:hypothetical protein
MRAGRVRVYDEVMEKTKRCAMTMPAGGPQRCPGTRSSTIACTVILMAALAFSSCLHAPSRRDDPIAEKIIAAYGGRDRIAQVASLAAEGRIRALVRGDEGIYRRAQRRDGKLFVDIIYRYSSERRLLDGTRGYRGSPNSMEEVSGPRYLAMVYQYDQLDLPYGLLDNSLTLTELRSDTLNTQAVRVFLCRDRAGNEMEVFVNAENYRIVKCTGTFRMETGVTSLSAEFSDYRIVEGILFPFRVVNFANEQKISETEITGYLINPRIDDELFRP